MATEVVARLASVKNRGLREKTAGMFWYLKLAQVAINRKTRLLRVRVKKKRAKPPPKRLNPPP